MTIIDILVFAIIALLVSSTAIMIFEAGLLLVNILMRRSKHCTTTARAYSE